MNFSHYGDDAVAITVDLVNTPFERVRDLEQFLAERGIVRGRSIGTAEVTGVNGLRGRLREIFDVATAGDERDAAARLNALVVESDVRPELTDHDGTWHLHYAPVGADLVRRLTASAAMALAGVLVSFGADRLKVCDSDTCDDVFVDTSRNRSRRYCSDRCSNRENVAAFRARRRAVGGPRG